MRRIILLITSLTILSCTKEETQTIKGTAVGIDNGTAIYLEELGENNKRTPVDTAVVRDESFQFTKVQSDGLGIQVISAQGVNGQLLIVKDKAPLKITLYKDSITSSLVSGSEENELFNTYRNTNRQRNTRKSQLIKDMRRAQAETDGIAVENISAEIKELDDLFVTEKKAILENEGDKMVSVFALSDLINAKVLKVEETETYFNSLSEEVKKSSVGNSINKYIAQQKSQRIAAKLADIGNKAPEFSAPTPEGEDLALSQTLGKYTIIDFWASWCRPCRMENPNVVRVYNKYHDKGLNIISVSLDRQGQEERWKKAIIQDQMDWYHVSNLQFWQDPIAKSYGVRSIPATFLLDENGVIIAKNLRGAALENKIAELLGNS